MKIPSQSASWRKNCAIFYLRVLGLCLLSVSPSVSIALSAGVICSQNPGDPTTNCTAIQSCNRSGCHANAISNNLSLDEADVALTLLPRVQSGGITSFNFSVPHLAGAARAGFSLSVSTGTLGVGTAFNARTIGAGGNLTHNTLAAFAWQGFTWQAPTVADVSTFYYCVMEVNGAAGNSGDGRSACATRSITVFTPPTALSTQVETVEDMASVPIVLGGTNGATIYQIASLPSNGMLLSGGTQVVLESTGLLTNGRRTLHYSPDANYHGNDSFTFRVSNGIDGFLTPVATVMIQVVAVNDLPVSTEMTITRTILEDSVLELTLSDLHVDDIDSTTGALFIHVLTLSSGTISTQLPLRYRPPDHFTGSARAMIRVCDSGIGTGIDAGCSSNITLMVTVQSVNDPPMFIESFVVSGTQQILTTFPVRGEEDSNLSFYYRLRDIDSTLLIPQIVTAPTNGMAMLTSTAFTVNTSGIATIGVQYTPNAQFFGSDTLRVNIRDPDGGDTTVINTVLILPVNDPPVATPVSAVLVAAVPTVITLAASDADHTMTDLFFTIVTPPTAGILSPVQNNQVLYTPTGTQTTAHFTFRVHDADGAMSAPATVHITINNAPPIANDSTIAVAQGTTAQFTLSSADVDSNSAVLQITALPSTGVFLYQGMPFSIGSTLTMRPSFNFRTNMYTGTSSPLHYFAPPDFVGDTTALFRVMDDKNVLSATATITFRVLQIDVAPLSTPTFFHTDVSTANFSIATSTFTLNEDSSLTITFNAATARVCVTLLPTSGSITSMGSLVGIGCTTSNVLTYTPLPNYNGSDSWNIQFEVATQTFSLGESSVTVFINPVDDLPTAPQIQVPLQEDTVANFILQGGSDVDGDALTYRIITPPRHGSIIPSLPNIQYTPSPHFFGLDFMTYAVHDGTFTSAEAQVFFTVHPVPDAPITGVGTSTQNATIIHVLEDTTALVVINAQDREGLSDGYVELISVPSSGTLSLMGTPGTLAAGTTATFSATHVALRQLSLLYTPAAHFVGMETLAYRVSDSGGTFSTAVTVTIMVHDAADPPSSADLITAVNEDGVIDLQLSLESVTTNVDAGNIAFIFTSVPQNGSLTGSLYRPHPNYNGSDQINFIAYNVNSLLQSSPHTISIAVTPIADLPTTPTVTVLLNEDTDVDFTVDIRLPLSGTTTGTIIQLSSGNLMMAGNMLGVGSAINFIDGIATLNYRPRAHFRGLDNFVFQYGTLLRPTINFIVYNQPDRPLAISDSFMGLEDTLIPLTVRGSDSDGDPLSWLLRSSPPGAMFSATSGMLQGDSITSATFIVHYRPPPNFFGLTTITYTINDGSTDSLPASLSVTIIPVNDTPTATPVQVMLDEDTSSTITLRAMDVDGDALSYEILSAPLKGTIVPTTGSFVAGVATLTYTTNLHENGQDTATFVANDFVSSSLPTTVTLMIQPINDTPSVAINDSTPVAGVGNLLPSSANVVVVEDSSVQIVLRGADVEDIGTSLRVRLTSSPTNGTLADNNGVSIDTSGQYFLNNNGEYVLYYHPQPNYPPQNHTSGTDNFRFVVSDNEGLESPQYTVNIEITPINDIPEERQGLLSLVLPVINTSVTVTTANLSWIDVDNPPEEIVYQVAELPEEGDLLNIFTSSIMASGSTFTQKALNDGNIVYNHHIPRGDASNGRDEILYAVHDTDAPAMVVTQTLVAIIDSNNTTPTIVTATIWVDEGGVVAIDDNVLRLIDRDGPLDFDIIYTLISTPQYGVLMLEHGFLGTGDIFSQEDVNDDLMRDMMGIDQRLRYVHDGSENPNPPIRTTSFNLTVYDGATVSLPLSLQINIRDVNDVPHIVSTGTLVLDEGSEAVLTSMSLSVADNDHPVSQILYNIVQEPSYGRLIKADTPDERVTQFSQAMLDAGMVSYRHDGSETTSDKFIYLVRDGANDTISNQFYDIEVNPVNDTPVAYPDYFSVISSCETPPVINRFMPQRNDFDSENQFLDIVQVTPIQASATITIDTETNSIHYIPLCRQVTLPQQPEVMHYTISDEDGARSSSTIQVVITLPHDSDNDGLPNEWEIIYGLNPLNADSDNDGISDALEDLDGDLLPNANEYFMDQLPGYAVVWQLSQMQQIIAAVGRLTPLSALERPSAQLFNTSQSLTVFAPAVSLSLTTGRHIITWRATFEGISQPVESTINQTIYIIPIVEVGNNQVLGEGSTGTIQFILNGVTPFYPVTVTYTVSGTAMVGDSCASGVDVVLPSFRNTMITQGQTSAAINFSICNDDVQEGEETIVVRLQSAIGATLRGNRDHRISIIEDNFPSTAWFDLRQDGVLLSNNVIPISTTPVSVLLNIRDPNADNQQNISWRGSDASFAAPMSSVRMFSFDARNLIPHRLYRLAVTITDNGAPPMRTDIASVWRASTVTQHSSLPMHVMHVYPNSSPPYLIETMPGLVLQPSAIALAGSTISGGVGVTYHQIAQFGGENGDMVTSTAIVTDSKFVDISAIYSFVVNRAMPGQDIGIIFELPIGLTSDAQWRRYNRRAGMWQSVVANAASGTQFASIIGDSTRGCPPPGSSAYVLGLHGSSRCVRISLRDGGIYDDDRMANGVLETTIKLALPQKVIPPTPILARGGAIGQIILYLLLLLVGVKIYLIIARKIKLCRFINQ